MLRRFQEKKSFRFAIISVLLTAAALGAATISAVAGQIGEYELASLGSKAALGLAAIIVIYVVPRLARNVRLEYLHSEFTIHVPNAGLVFCALILVVAILALTSGNNLIYLVLAVLMATIFISWLASRLSLGRIGVTVRYPDHNFAGEAIPFDITIENRKRLFPAFSLAVGMSEQKSGSNSHELAEMAYFPIIPARTRARMRVERRFVKRGVYPVRGFVIGARFPFGFLEQRRFIEATSEITVYPQPQPLDEFTHLPPLTQGRFESLFKGGGSDLYAIRQYHSADHHHHIDWKATAKTAQLMVREFTRDDDLRVTIVFDGELDPETAEMAEFIEKFEKAIILAASLIDHFIGEDAEVRLITGGFDSGFGIGRSHNYAMLRQLSELEPGKSSELPDLGFDDQLRILIAAKPPSAAGESASHITHVIGFDEC